MSQDICTFGAPAWLSWWKGEGKEKEKKDICAFCRCFLGTHLSRLCALFWERQNQPDTCTQGLYRLEGDPDKESLCVAPSEKPRNSSTSRAPRAQTIGARERHWEEFPRGLIPEPILQKISSTDGLSVMYKAEVRVHSGV